MTFLVVGGAGYIGSVVVGELVRGRHSVIALDDLSTGHRDAVSPLAVLVEGGLQDPAKLREAFETKEVDCVIHLAARSIVADSIADPDSYRRANVDLGVCLLDAMREHGVREIIFSSSAAVYDERAAMPLGESSLIRPSNPYGETKRRFEEILRERADRGEFRYVALRFFNVAGASIDLGEDHRTETHLVPIAIDTARGARGPVPIYGSDYPTPDGTAIRDYVHVVDVAEAHVRAARYLADGGASTVLNLGSERGSSVRDVVAAVERVAGRSVATTPAPRRVGDP
ncbi:MAG: UDP-glucose 4-epimerase GalE, partial [Candidatus Eiseniibacteriota bacterium]